MTHVVTVSMAFWRTARVWWWTAWVGILNEYGLGVGWQPPWREDFSSTYVCTFCPSIDPNIHTYRQTDIHTFMHSYTDTQVLVCTFAFFRPRLATGVDPSTRPCVARLKATQPRAVGRMVLQSRPRVVSTVLPSSPSGWVLWTGEPISFISFALIHLMTSHSLWLPLIFLGKDLGNVETKRRFRILSANCGLLDSRARSERGPPVSCQGSDGETGCAVPRCR